MKEFNTTAFAFASESGDLTDTDSSSDSDGPGATRREFAWPNAKGLWIEKEL